MATSISTSREFKAGSPRKLFGGPFVWERLGNYDVSPDGKRFLMVQASEETRKSTELRVVLNWFEELKRLVPTKK